MSNKSSFLEAIEQRAAIRADRPKPSGTSVNIRLTASKTIPQPVAVARELTRYGLSLKQAHGALEDIVGGEGCVVVLTSADLVALVDAFARLGVSAAVVDVRHDERPLAAISHKSRGKLTDGTGPALS